MRLAPGLPCALLCLIIDAASTKQLAYNPSLVGNVPILLLHGHAGSSSDVYTWEAAITAVEIARQQFHDLIALPSGASAIEQSRAGPVYSYNFHNQYTATNIQYFLSQVTAVREAMTTIMQDQNELWNSGNAGSLPRRTLILGGFSMGGAVAQYVMAEYLDDAVKSGCKFEETQLRRPYDCSKSFLQRWPMDIGLLVTISSPVRQAIYPLGLAWQSLYRITIDRLKNAIDKMGVKWSFAFPLMINYCGGQTDMMVACMLTNLEGILNDNATMMPYPALDTIPAAQSTTKDGHMGAVTNHDFLHRIVAPMMLLYARLYEFADSLGPNISATTSKEESELLILGSAYLLFQLDVSVPAHSGHVNYGSNLAHLINKLHICSEGSDTTTAYVVALLDLSEHMINTPGMPEMDQIILPNGGLWPYSTRLNVIQELSASPLTTLTMGSKYVHSSVANSGEWLGENLSTFSNELSLPWKARRRLDVDFASKTLREECAELSLDEVIDCPANDTASLETLSVLMPAVVKLNDIDETSNVFSVEMILDPEINNVATYWMSSLRIQKRVPLNGYPIRHHRVGGLTKDVYLHYGLVDLDHYDKAAAETHLLIATLRQTKSVIVIRPLPTGTPIAELWPSQKVDRWNRRQKRNFVAYTQADFYTTPSDSGNTSHHAGLLTESIALTATDLLVMLSTSGRYVMPYDVQCYWSKLSSVDPDTGKGGLRRECEHRFRPRHRDLVVEDWKFISVNAQEPVYKVNEELLTQSQMQITKINIEEHGYDRYISIAAAHGITFLILASSFTTCYCGFHLIIQGVARCPRLYTSMSEIHFVHGYSYLGALGAIFKLLCVICFPAWRIDAIKDDDDTTASSSVIPVLKRVLLPGVIFNAIWTVFILLLSTFPNFGSHEDVFDDFNWFSIVAIVWGIFTFILVVACLVLAFATMMFLLFWKHQRCFCAKSLSIKASICLVAKVLCLVCILAIIILLPSFIPFITLFAAAYLVIKSVLHIPVRNVKATICRRPDYRLDPIPQPPAHPTQISSLSEAVSAMNTDRAVTQLNQEERKRYENACQYYHLRSAMYLIVAALVLYQACNSLFYFMSQLQEIFSLDKRFLFVGGYKSSLGLLTSGNGPDATRYYLAVLFDLYLAPIVPVLLIMVLLRGFNRRCGLINAESCGENPASLRRLLWWRRAPSHPKPQANTTDVSQLTTEDSDTTQTAAAIEMVKAPGGLRPSFPIEPPSHVNLYWPREMEAFHPPYYQSRSFLNQWPYAVGAEEYNISEGTTPTHATLELFRQRRQISLENFIIPVQSTAKRDGIISIISGSIIIAIGLLCPLITRLSTTPFYVFATLAALFVCLLTEGYLMFQHHTRKQPFLM